jgi:hypothetical protein
VLSHLVTFDSEMILPPVSEDCLLTLFSRSGESDIAAFAAAASKASAGVHPSNMSGGKLMDDAQIAALTSVASGTPTPTSTPKASSTAAQASASPTGAASVLKGSVVVAGAVGGVLALVL